jgi:dTDP-4-dehydrorhamnose reductase
VATYLSETGHRSDVDWRRVDVRERSEVTRLVDDIRPDFVVNAAFRQKDWRATAEGPAHLAAAVARSGARLVQVSSDAVFSGRAKIYDEASAPDPITPYGAAKAAAETAVAAIAPDAVIARTSLIIGDGGSAHERTVRSLLDGRPGVLFVDDIRCPVHVADLTAALRELAVSTRSGIHHVAGADAISRYELGCLIALRGGRDPSGLSRGRRAGSGVPGPVAVRLDCAATRRVLTTRLRGVREFLRVQPV